MMTRGSLRWRRISSPSLTGRLRLRRLHAHRTPARGDFPRNEVEEPAAHEVRLHATTELVRRPLADLEQLRLVDVRHGVLQRGEIAERLRAHQLSVAAIVEQVLARDRVERGDDLDPRAADPFVEPEVPHPEDFDD